MAHTNHIQETNFASLKNSLTPEDLLRIQVESYKEFLNIDHVQDKTKEKLYQVFQEYFPISDSKNIYTLEFEDYLIGVPSYTMAECLIRGLTYSVPITVKLRLKCNDAEHEDFEEKTEDVFLGNIPYMTPGGTFIINGAERVVVSQLHRSPGVFFGQSFHTNGMKLYSARIIPFRGSWIEFVTDINNVMFAYIDRKKKLPMTTLLRAIGYETDKDILNIFGLAQEVKINKTTMKNHIGRKLAARVLHTWHEDVVDEDTGEVEMRERSRVIVNRDTVLEKEHLMDIFEAGTPTILLHKEEIEDETSDQMIVYNTLQKDITNTKKEAVEYVYQVLRGSDAPDEETAFGIIDKLFFSEVRYSLGNVGRYSINKKLNLNVDEAAQTLTKEDIIEIIKHLILLVNSNAEVDDIDHLSNRRLRIVGEQLVDQIRTGLSRMTRTIRDKMNIRDNEVFTAKDLVYTKTFTSVINSFFGTSQLSQFMDQTNPLSEITHKRRLSALGPGGLSRERAGFEVRDVHYTHYGRICPIETPEGPNIGLISSLCIFAQVNELGFIETPYRRVNDKSVDLSGELVYLTAEEEDEHVIAQASAPLDEEGKFVNEKVKVRMRGDFRIVPAEEVEYMDIAPNQITSISAALIPFLEHDDANRALMGSNMMRQAVPLIRPEAPIVGTGIEKLVARDSRILINAEKDGEVVYVDAKTIKVKYDYEEEEILVSFDDEVTTYDLVKFRKTNQNTCVNLKPIVRVGDRVKKGQLLCEGFATNNGELALGRNMLAAFMPWKGYNFEDAIVISERVVKDDVFTSIHIEEHTAELRDTKLGAEEFAKDIPNIGEDVVKDLDENGIIRVGAEVKPGDIIIGKITPKGESDPTPEEKLLRAIFGDKAGDVKDTSVRATPSLNGVVIQNKLFLKNSANKRQSRGDSYKEAREKYVEKYNEECEELRQKLIDKLHSLISGKMSQGVYNYNTGEEIISKGKKYTLKLLRSIENYHDLDTQGWIINADTRFIISKLLYNYKSKYLYLKGVLERKIYLAISGDELPAGVISLAKVYIAKKRKLKVGDKMAGRHGNKGILARIVREEDMPFLEDGTPVDIVLNPLGVPSRMNLGQIYETVLGWVGKKLGQKFITPVFDGATLNNIDELTKKAGIPQYGHTYLYDGGTGERFDQPATVGVIYILKLGHLVDDKIHARSTGPYSLITQQPMGGKSQNGGQRFGEMEVWALEAFGASNILREVLTIKSDDTEGRAKTYKAIVAGDKFPQPGIPESFNVLLNELSGLALDVRLEGEGEANA